MDNPPTHYSAGAIPAPVGGEVTTSRELDRSIQVAGFQALHNPEVLDADASVLDLQSLTSDSWDQETADTRKSSEVEQAVDGAHGPANAQQEDEWVFELMLAEASLSWAAINHLLGELTRAVASDHATSDRRAETALSHCSNLIQRVVQLHAYARDSVVPLVSDWTNPRVTDSGAYNTAGNVRPTFDQMYGWLHDAFTSGAEFFGPASGSDLPTETNESSRRAAFKKLLDQSDRIRDGIYGRGGRLSLVQQWTRFAVPHGQAEGVAAGPLEALETLPVPDLFSMLVHEVAEEHRADDSTTESLP